MECKSKQFAITMMEIAKIVFGMKILRIEYFNSPSNEAKENHFRKKSQRRTLYIIFEFKIELENKNKSQTYEGEYKAEADPK